MKNIRNIIASIYLLVIISAIAFAAIKVWEFENLATKVILSLCISWAVVIAIYAISKDHQAANKPK